MSEAKRQIDLSILPRYAEGPCRGKIDWGSIPSGTKINFKYEDTCGNLEIMAYDKKTGKLKICYNNSCYQIKASKLFQCQISKIVGTRRRWSKYSAGDIISNDTFDITILSDPTQTYSGEYIYKCNKCGNIDRTRIKVITRGKMVCSVCSHQKVLQGVNDIPTTDPWMVPYFQGGYDEAKQYTSRSGKRIYPICPHCKRVKKISLTINNIYYKKSIGCSCQDGISYPNKFTFSFIEQLGVDFVSEYSPEWVKPYRYDFYIPNKNLIIEIDGGIGHGNQTRFSSKEESLSRDLYKDKIAKEHGIKVLRIKCTNSDFNTMKNGLKESLQNIFDTSTINWLECEEYALSNIQKTVCQYFNQHKEATVTDISKVFHLNRKTIREYLKKGTDIGWCNYNVDDARVEGYKKATSNIIKYRSKPIYVYDASGNYIKRYDSISEASKSSINDLGINLSKNGITDVLKSRKNNYKSFVFSYVN